jgi:hypothetical protein
VGRSTPDIRLENVFSYLIANTGLHSRIGSEQLERRPAGID